MLRASRKGAASAHKIASVSNLLATWACFLAYMTHVYTRVRDRRCRGVSLVSDDRTGLLISPLERRISFPSSLYDSRVR